MTANCDARALRAAAFEDITSIEDELAAEVDCEVNKAIETSDPARAWGLTDRLAMLPEAKRGAVVSRLKTAFGVNLGRRQFDKAVTAAAGKLSVVEPGDRGDWRRLLHRSPATGNPIPSYDNVAIAFENAPEWAGVLAYNEFTCEIVAIRQPPSPVTAKAGAAIRDSFVTDATRWLERQGIMAKPAGVHQVIDAVARRSAYHPVRDYLNALPDWDGTPRIGSWLIDYCGVQSSDSEPNVYAGAVGEKFLISAVARIMQPGCKVDSMLILEGEQGLRKSSAARVLAGDEWFTDSVKEFGTRDCAMQLQGKWIVEAGELGAMRRAEVEHVKAFLSMQTERFRPPYGRCVVDQPRQSVLIGTTNHDTYLQDETGGRRFWPVKCGRIDLEGLTRDRDQLWAEALLRYRAGAHWWLEDEAVIVAATEQQRERFSEDIWSCQVAEFAAEEAERTTAAYPEGQGSVSVREILLRLGVETAKQDQLQSTRVARILRADGWQRFKAGRRGARQWRYRRPVGAVSQ